MVCCSNTVFWSFSTTYNSFTSDEEIGDELEIKPPQAQLLARREKRSNRDRYRKDNRRGNEDDRNRRTFEQGQPPPPSRGNRHLYTGQPGKDRSYGRAKDKEGSGSRSHGKNTSEKYSTSESKLGERRDRVKELSEKRMHMEQEEERYFREIRDRRERQHREETKKLETEKRNKHKSRTPSPLLRKSNIEEDEPKLKIERTKESKSSSSLFPEVEDIEESSSDLEDGEASPAHMHSDVSASEDDKFGAGKSVDNSPHSAHSNKRSSSPSQSDSDSKMSSVSKSSDSEDDGRNDERNGGDSGERPSKLFKSDSPGSPVSEKHLKQVDEFHGNEDKARANTSDLIDVEEATDVLNLLPPYYPAIQGCRRVEEFQLLNRIEEGTYGVVYRAKDKRTNEIVALKRLKMEKEKDGFPITSLREINTLLKAQHENIVTVREIVVGSNTDKIFLVMDYVEHDLKSLMETLRQKEQAFMEGEVKCLMIQLLRAVAHLHDNWILHRDLKTSNLLLSHKGILKVGDFGLAREYGSPLKQYTPIVVTLWYRAPELLLQMRDYSTPIDIWSLGCIFGELLKMEPMFPGKSEANQLNLIFQTLGTPNDKIWPGYSQLPLLQKMTFADYPLNKLKTRFPQLSETGIDLMNNFGLVWYHSDTRAYTISYYKDELNEELQIHMMRELAKICFDPTHSPTTFLTFNPAKRITAEDALRHKFFGEPPLPIDPSVFPTWPAKSELGHRKAAASPKPPSGGRQFKDLRDEDGDPTGFFLGAGDRRPPIGPGFNLKF